MINLTCQNPNCKNKDQISIEMENFPKSYKCNECNCIMVLTNYDHVPLKNIKMKDAKVKK
jgi:hypothetical protein